MNISDEIVNSGVELLWDCHEKKQSIGPLSTRMPNLTIEMAYKISQSICRRRIQLHNDKLIGRKIGLTSQSVQRQLGVHEPDFGYLTHAMQIPNSGKIPMAGLRWPKIETELAFKLKSSLDGSDFDEEAIIEATEWVAPCLEIIDSRIENWNIKIQDTVADNASAAFFVLGKAVSPAGLDFKRATMLMKQNGSVVSTGTGADCLGHPALAVAWLARKLASLGEPLQKGELILAGAWGPVCAVKAGDFFNSELAGIGQVEVHFGQS